MKEFLEVLFTLFLVFTVAHYTLSIPFWPSKGEPAANRAWWVIGLSVLFAVLFVLFAGIFSATKLT